MTRRSRPVELSDAPEHRNIPLDRVEFRNEDENTFTIEGYASTFQEYEMYGGPANYGWIERIDRSAFDKTLREKPDLHLLINHAGTPLARTKSGTCRLEADDHGLKVIATLDKRDPEAMGIFVKMERGDMDEMSFAFRVKAQEWRAADGYEDDDQSYRTITEVSLHKGDVSIVNWGANDTTSVGIRSAADALKVLANADEDELAELRNDGSILGDVLRKLAADGVKQVEVGKSFGTQGPTIVIENMHSVRSEEVGTIPVTMIDGIDSILASLSFDSLIAEVATAGLLESFREAIIGKLEERDEEEIETDDEPADEARDEEVDEDATEAVEETVDESREEASEAAPQKTGRSLATALAEMGIVPEEKLSLDAALALL